MIGIRFKSWGKWDTLTAEEYTALRTRFPSLEAEKPRYVHGTFYADYDDLRFIADFGLEVDIQALPENMLVRLTDRVKALEARTQDSAGLIQKIVDGAAVVIHVPNNVLSFIDEVTYLEDSCTNVLQDHLDQGWRMLAVCPPNAQRRPDYILGRRKADYPDAER